MQVKYRCKKCGHSEPKKPMQYFLEQLTVFIMGLLIMSGMVFWFIALQVDVMPIVVDAFVETELESITDDFADSTTLRKQAVIYTAKCDTETDRMQQVSSYCHAYHLYLGLKDIRYLPTQNLDKLYENPDDILDMRAGDCKEVSMLYVTMMKSLGFDAEMECDYDAEHCVAVVPNIYNYEKDWGYLVVDLTIPAIYRMHDGVDPWKFKDEGILYG